MNDSNKAKWFLFKRKLAKIAVYLEAIYVVGLAIALIYNFAIFAHMLVWQFFIILAYFVTGWIVDLYLKLTGKAPVDERTKKSSFKDKISEMFPSYSKTKSFYRLLSTLTVIASFIILMLILATIFNDLYDPKNQWGIGDSLTLYLSSADIITLMMIVVGLLMGYRRATRNGGFVAMIVAVILMIIWPHFWLIYLFNLLSGASAFFLYLRNQI